MDNKTLAEIFVSCFCEFYCPDCGKHTQLIDSIAQPMPEIPIGTAQDLRALESLNPYKGAGPDSLHPKVLNTLASFMAQPLAGMFKLSLSSAEIPEDWRQAIVCLIHKEGDHEGAGNYRSVGLQCDRNNYQVSYPQPLTADGLTEQHAAWFYPLTIPPHKSSCHRTNSETYGHR